MSQRFEGKNVDDALTQAAEALGVERYRLTYHVVVEKRGFLGGVKRVVIEAEVNEAAAEAAPPEPQAAPTGRGAPFSSPGRGAPVSSPAQGRGGRGGRGGRRERGSGRGERGERHHRGGRERRERFDDFEAPDVPAQGPETDEARMVREWCEEVLRRGQFDVILRTEQTEQQIALKLYGRDARLFVDRNGELLDALQVLANKALVGRKVEKDIELDCSEFKERRVEELGEQARRTADRVRRDGREQLLPAMSPIERRIVHLALQDDAEVMTESRGDGFFKRVAIKLRPPAEQTTQEP